ncbi:MAG: hypothetical protein HYS13_05520 [Planctomycetia bacterium]|nr:hypothetical protein [Planctomycetia bacterium]
MNRGITVNRKFHVTQRRRGAKELRPGEAAPTPAPGRVPRIARLMALAIRFDRLIREGVVADQAELARLGRVTRARITQIMNLLLLAPDIQEAILFLPPIERGRDAMHLRDVLPVAANADWRKQRRMWAAAQRA